MFNVYLPKLLETRGIDPNGAPKSLQDSLWDVVIYSLGGCPGAIVSLYVSCLNTSHIFLMNGLLGLIARRVAHRIAPGTTLVSSREHVHDRSLLLAVRGRRAPVAGACEHGRS